MTFESIQTIRPGASVMVRLIPGENRLVIEAVGAVTPVEIEAALPELLTHLATKAGLPVRQGGRVYRPGQLPQPV